MLTRFPNTRLVKSCLGLMLCLLLAPLGNLPAQQPADRWPCPRDVQSGRHICTVGGRRIPYILILIRLGNRAQLLEEIREDMTDSLDESDAGTPQDLFDDIRDDFFDDQELGDDFDIGYYDIDEMLRMSGTTFDNIIRAAVNEEFGLRLQPSRASIVVTKRRVATRTVNKLGAAFPYR